MARKRRRREATRTDQQSSTSAFVADALIEPSLLKIAALLKAGKLPPEEQAKPLTQKWSARLPPELLPFMQSLSLAKLADALKEFPLLYWHPLVQRQLLHMLKHRHELKAEVLASDGAQDAVAAVTEGLKTLLESHAAAFLAYERITWQRRRRAGRPPAFSYAGYGPDVAITGDLLVEDYETLLTEFRRCDLTIQPGEGERDSLARISKYVRAAYRKVEHLSVDDYTVVAEKRRRRKDWWAEKVEKITPHYREFDRGQLVRLIVDVCLERAIKVGNKTRKVWSAASYLAYGVLGLHYGLNLEDVRGLIERESRKRKRRRGPS